jgi:ribonucleotide monophosphatase NagD (HAD superfamily)
VLVGDCRDVLDYAVLDAAFRAVRAGAELVALQRGRYFRREDGDHLDTGAVVAGLEYSAGVHARVLGKPSTDFFDLAARSLGLSVQECAVVGDDATTDIAGGRDAGARTVQVRTGKYADQHAEGITGSADATIDSIADLPAFLQGS